MSSKERELEFDVVEEAPAGFAVDAARLRSLTCYVLSAEGACGAWAITVALVSEANLQALHKQFMQDDTPTDIMTFPTESDQGAHGGGDLAISVAHLHDRASEWGNTPAEELEFLVAHGVLHLLGYGDATFADRAAMLARQRQLISAWQEASTP